MKLTLSKPLAFIDLETTGLDVSKDRIVEISIMKLEPTGKQAWLTSRINPGIPIPAESSAIHGITDEDVAGEPDFKTFGSRVKIFIGNADLAGYNSNKFDIPLLIEEFYRNNIAFDMEKRKLIDVQNIFHKMEKRTLEAAYKFYCNRDLENAHSAESDVRATFEVLEAQIEKYADLKPNVAFLHEFSNLNQNADFAGRIIYNKQGDPVFNFGKYKGQHVTDVFEKDPSYYNWMMDSDFTQNTKHVLTSIKLKHKLNQ